MAYLTVTQINNEMTSLAGGATAICKKTPFPNPTVSEGVGPTTYSFLEIANGTGANRVTALAVAGMHAREWAQPDAVISFAKKLIAAYRSNTAFVIPAYTEGPNTFGPVSVPAAQVKALIDTLNIILVPLANPDGRVFSQSAVANNLWRKNRAPRLIAANPKTVGVDLNRNFDIAWDFDRFYNVAFRNSGILRSSKDPATDSFIGRAKPAPNDRHPENEPEVKNLIWLLDNRPVTFSVDLHSAALKIMHPWGIERNGTVAAQNFRDLALDGTRDGTLGNAYSEFFPNSPPARLQDKHDTIVKSMRDRIVAATGRTYGVGGIADVVYPATGTFTDFHFSRQFTIAGSPQIHAFAAEFGTTGDGFQPHPTNADGYPKIEREIHALLLAFFEAALASVPAPPAGGGGGGSGSGSGGTCLFTLAVSELVAGRAWLETLWQGRAMLLGWRYTRGAMLALDRAYRRVSTLIVPHLVERRWAKRAIAFGLVAPTAAITGLALKGRTR
jgi:hypothetical protein